jgi:hypothetical protein
VKRQNARPFRRSYQPRHTSNSAIASYVLSFLVDVHKKGKSYRTINVARSMLSSTLNLKPVSSPGAEEVSLTYRFYYFLSSYSYSV